MVKRCRKSGRREAAACPVGTRAWRSAPRATADRELRILERLTTGLGSAKLMIVARTM